MRSTPHLVVVTLSLMLISQILPADAAAQIGAPGPSPANLFSTVYNVPGDTLPAGEITGFPARQINVTNGGTASFNFSQTDQFGPGTRGEVNIAGGTILGGSSIDINSELNVSGGVVGDGFTGGSNNQINLSGGQIGNDFGPGGNADVNITGGTIGDNFTAGSGSYVNITAGSIGNDFTAAFSTDVSISAGSIGNGFRAAFASDVTISGGTIGDNFTSQNANEITISGGTIGSGLSLGTNNNLDITGGNVDGDLVVGNNGMVDISGGTLDGNISAAGNSEIRLVGTEFFFAGTQLNGLSFTQETLIPQRSGLLTGRLLDGSDIELDLSVFNAVNFNPPTLSVTLGESTAVPEPGAAVLLGLCSLGMLARRRR